MKTPTVIVKITINKFPVPNGKYIAVDDDGVNYTDDIKLGALKKAYMLNYRLGKFTKPDGSHQWRKVDIPNDDSKTTEPKPPAPKKVLNLSAEQTELMSFIHNSYNLKPASLVMNELKWKYLIRSAVRGKNIMMTGQAGCGKTMAAKALVNALDKPDFYFNMGATQDPRSTLIGNTHYNEKDGTYFSESYFVQAIRTPNAVILLDELTRAHPDAWNILMPVLDYGQRYLRLDEKNNSETVKVAEGVTFIATANIGNEYTATRVLDRALMDRFTIIEMDILNNEEEHGLLKYMFPNIENKTLENISQIAHLTRIESKNDNPRIGSGISTRTSVELAGLIYDGFGLLEASEITIYPQYDASGGVDSERTFVKQIIQKFMDDGSDDHLFNEEEVADASKA